MAVKDHPLGRCYEPTPELRHIPPEGNKLYFPEYTILHVCRNISGCCWNPMQECAEKDIEIVSKSFIVSIKVIYMLMLFLCHLQTTYGLLHLNSESYKLSNRSGHTKD